MPKVTRRGRPVVARADAFKPTICTVVRRDGRDCNRLVAEDAPLPLCLEHIRDAYLYYIDHLKVRYADRVITDDERQDLAKAPPGVDGFRESQSAVYYVRIGYFIKIGVSRSLASRMTMLQPDEILALEPGDLEKERERHAQFAHIRAPKGREYFYPTVELMDHIKAIKDLDWKPTALPIEIPGYLPGVPCGNCGMLSIFHDGIKEQCTTCGGEDAPTSTFLTDPKIDIH